MKNKLETIVCDLKYSKELDELGVEQTSLFYWCNYKNFLHTGDIKSEYHIKFINDISKKPRTIVDFLKTKKLEGAKNLSAFTTTELGIKIPEEIIINKNIILGLGLEDAKIGDRADIEFWKNSNKFCVGLCAYGFNTIGEKKEANAKAEFLIYLLKNNLIKP